ncbi:aspartyl/asparaginyl beta-hydroxylase domain-containing protein [Ideonella sp.]|uniref:aspartyl/asparaginyl beta-hydroxylase domain-containing protein n=1 Tax=Ideonella sp. TaxID=1929293 RepID=UPI0035B1F053
MNAACADSPSDASAPDPTPAPARAADAAALDARRRAEEAFVRGDLAGMCELLEQACGLAPDRLGWAEDLAYAWLRHGQPLRARMLLDQRHAASRSSATTWLLLGHALAATGEPQRAVPAWERGLQRARAAGQWRSAGTTPAHLRPLVSQAMQQAFAARRALLHRVLDEQRTLVGPQALRRVERAVSGYLREWDATPPDRRQRPKFFYFPELPSPPYHDPFLQPWAATLQAHWQAIRDEALAVLAEPGQLSAFLDFPAGAKVDDYVGGAGPAPAWDAYFFYRHGQRYDAHHARCPRTSALLDSIELCRIEGQAPEVCYSVLAPGSHIKPHYGVTNTRLVFHLPLVVPPDCALHVIDAGEHAWREGEPMMFDDTFQHEAWNRSDRVRVILLMDCWNPHLTPEERIAVKALVESISRFEQAEP